MSRSTEQSRSPTLRRMIVLLCLTAGATLSVHELGAQEPASESAAGESAAGESAAGESAAGESAAGESAAGESAAGESAAGESAAGESAAGESATFKRPKKCVFVMPAWNSFVNNDQENFPGATVDQRKAIRESIARAFKNDGAKLNPKDLIHLAIAHDTNGKPLFPQCSPDAKATDLLQSVFQDISTYLRAMLALLGLLIAVLVTLASLEYRQRRRLLAKPPSNGLHQKTKTTHHIGGYIESAALREWWISKDGPQSAQTALTAAITRLEPQLERIAAGINAGKTKDAESLTTTRAPTETLRPSTPPRTPYPSSANGTGPVSELRATVGTAPQRFAWYGANSLFQADSQGPVVISSNTGFLIPMRDRVQRLSDWYDIQGFDFDNQQTGALIIDQQPVLQRQADGSYLLQRKGRLHAVTNG